MTRLTRFANVSTMKWLERIILAVLLKVLDRVLSHLVLKISLEQIRSKVRFFLVRAKINGKQSRTWDRRDPKFLTLFGVLLLPFLIASLSVTLESIERGSLSGALSVSSMLLALVFAGLVDVASSRT